MSNREYCNRCSGGLIALEVSNTNVLSPCSKRAEPSTQGGICESTASAGWKLWIVPVAV